MARVWDFGDGTGSIEEEPAHTFSEGRWTVRLLGVDAAGCVGEDSVQIEADALRGRPPSCRATAVPLGGPAPLEVAFSGVSGDPNPGGRVTDAFWRFDDDGSVQPGAEARRTFIAAGYPRATFRVENDRGLGCSDWLLVGIQTAEALSPPQILSQPSRTTTCFASYRYRADGDGLPVARGSRPIEWRLSDEAPTGMAVDRQTGDIQWHPSGPARTEHVTLVAENSAGRAVQAFDIDVTCPPELGFTVSGCGCGRSPPAPVAMALVGAGLVRARRRRRGTAGGPPPPSAPVL